MVTLPGAPEREALAACFLGQSPAALLRPLGQALLGWGCADGAFDARELLRLVCGKAPELAEAPLNGEQAARLAALTARRAGQRYPLQYLEGSWPFLDLELAVGEGVLIPRADTEVVCEQAAACLQGQKEPRVLDLCAGSGCLGLGLKRLCPDARVTALEKSPQALPWLRKNAARALPGPQPAIRVVEGDLFTYQSQLEPAEWDMILSNPPYLTGQEMTALQPEVRWEPAMALDGGPDGGNFYRHIAGAYRFALRPGGWLVLEIGCGQRALVEDILRRAGWQAEPRCVQDHGGNDRVILIQNQ